MELYISLELEPAELRAFFVVFLFFAAVEKRRGASFSVLPSTSILITQDQDAEPPPLQ